MLTAMEETKEESMSLKNPATGTGVDDAVDRDVSLLSEDDIYMFNEGSHFRLYEKLGAHFITVKGREGTVFGVWAPNAETVDNDSGWRSAVPSFANRGYCCWMSRCQTWMRCYASACGQN